MWAEQKDGVALKERNELLGTVELNVSPGCVHRAG